jgi:hypothetical protein
MKKLLLRSRSIMKSFEKKPIKGGTPAIEKRSTVRLSTVNELKLNSFNEYRVFVLIAIVFSIDQKRDINDML